MLSKLLFLKWFQRGIYENYWSNMEKAVKHFEKSFFHSFRKPKPSIVTWKSEMSLIIYGTFKGQDNKVLQELFAKKILWGYKAAKSFISVKCNTWIANGVSH